jgi:hypothetical protein
MSKPDSKQAGPLTPEERQKAAREQRLAKALRDNLRRRKAPAPAASEPTDGAAD